MKGTVINTLHVLLYKQYKNDRLSLSDTTDAHIRPVAQWYRVLRVKVGIGRQPRRSHCSLPGCTQKKSATTHARI